MKSSSVLLITSAQNDLLAPTGKAWPMVRETVMQNDVPNKLSRLLGAARRAGIPVLHSPVAFDYEAMADFLPKSAIQGLIVGQQMLAQGQPGADFIVEASPQQGDIVLKARQGFSSFWANTIQQTLNEFGANTLYLAGMLAEGCVSSHARDAVENGYRPVVISDAMASTGREMLKAACLELALHTHAMHTTEQAVAAFAAYRGSQSDCRDESNTLAMHGLEECGEL